MKKTVYLETLKYPEDHIEKGETCELAIVKKY